MGKPVSSGYPTRSDTNRAVEPQKMVRECNFGFRKKRNCTLSSENKGRAAVLRLCSRICEKQVFL